MARPSVEILRYGRHPQKATDFLDRIERRARTFAWDVRQTPGYCGRSDLLVLYGPGEPVRWEWAEEHMRSGRNVVAFDLGYWGREFQTPRRKYRITFNARHPQEWVKVAPADYTQVPELRQSGNPSGPILLCGAGVKSARMYGDGIEWDREMAARLREAFPGRQIVYRPKPPRTDRLPGCSPSRYSDLCSEIQGASLVVCRHSNVSVDAAIWGVPCVCEDGIGAAFWTNDLHNIRRPSVEERRDFLARVACFQWTAAEAHDCWMFIRRMLPFDTPS